MAVKFIELNRQFNPVPIIDTDEKDRSYFYSMESSDGIHWDKLLTFPRVVILAEAGSGKTEEIKHQSKELLKEKAYSFFLRLEDVRENFEIAFEVGDLGLFQKWLDSDKIAYFFLDSVDEAKLKHENDFKNAMRIFERKIHKAISRTFVCITSRGSAWRANSDLQFLNDLLSYKEDTKVGNEKGSGSIQDFSVYTFSNLSIIQIKEFSGAFGVEDIEEFANQLKINEAEDFAKRPLDLLDLISFWKNHGKIGTRYELLESSIHNKISAVVIGRDPADISVSKLFNGAKKLAASLTFCKLSRVTIPAGEQKKEALTIELILEDWHQKEIETLLSRPIFEPSLYGTSRFSHRLIREFLTALWIRDKVEDKAISQDELHSIFYNEIYDVEVLIPALKPVLAWYVLLDEQFSTVVIDKSPEVFIEGGDSSKLPVEKRQHLLSRFCDLYGKKDQCFISFDSAAIKRFSSPEMGNLIDELLQKFYLYKDLRQILLQIAISSEMKECLDIAIKMSLDNDVEAFSRTLALKLINAVAGEQLKLSHAKEVIETIPKNNERLLAVVISELGNLLPFLELLQRVSELVTPPKKRFRDINFYLDNFAAGLNLKESVEGLEFLYKLIDSKPYVKKYNCYFSERYEWLLGCVQVLLVNIITHEKCETINEALLNSLTKVCSYGNTGYHRDGNRNDKISSLVSEWKDLNNELFWYEVKQSRIRMNEKVKKDGIKNPLNRWFQVGSIRRFWIFGYEDLDLAISWVKTKELVDDKFVAFSLAWQMVKEEGRQENDERKLDVIAREIDGAVELLGNFRNPVKADWQIQHENDEKQYIEEQAKEELAEKENAESWGVHIRENKHLINDLQYASEGRLTSVQLHLYDNLVKLSIDTNSYIYNDCSPLVLKFGDDISSMFSDFCILYWKHFEDNILLSEGSERNRTTIATIVALCGIEIENKENPRWVEYITSKNANSATRLSLCDLNDIPSWMNKVYAKYPDEIMFVYVNGIEWCYLDKSDNDNSNFVLDKIISSCDYLHDDIAIKIFPLVEKYTITKYRMLKQSILLLSLSKKISNSELSDLSKVKLAQETDHQLSYMWWALHIGTEPDKAISLFEIKLKTLDSEAATNLAMNVITSLHDKRGYGALTTRHEYQEVSHLILIYKIMHKYIREEDDTNRTDGGVYSPTTRDDAQHARNSLLSAIKDIAGEESYYALKLISKFWKDKPWKKSWIEHIALERAATDGDLIAMSEKEFAGYAKKLSKKETPNMVIGDVINSSVVQNSGQLSNSESANTVDSSKVAVNSNELYIEPSKDKKAWHESGKGKIALIFIAVVLTFVAKEFIAPLLLGK